MLRALKWLGLALLALVLLLVAAIAAGGVLLERGTFNPVIERQASAALGRQVKLGAAPGILLGWAPGLALGPLSVGNPDWAGDAPMATVEHVEAAISLPALLRGELVIPRIVVERPWVSLIRRADGRANWQFGPQQEPEKPASDEPLRLPRIELVELRGGRATFDDETTNRHLLATAEASVTPADTRAHLLADLGVGRRDPGQPPAQALASGEPARDGAVHLDGFAADPAAPQDKFELTATTKGERTDQLLALAGVAAKPLPAYALTATIARDGRAWQVRQLDASLGDSRVAGKGEVADLAALDGVNFNLDGDLPALGKLLAALDLGNRPLPALSLRATGSREGARNRLTLDAGLGQDRITAEASTQGPLADLGGLALKANAKGTQLGQLLPLMGLTEKPVPAYSLDATAERAGDKGAKIDLKASLGNTAFAAAGTIGDVKAAQAVDLDVSVAGQDPAEILDIFALPKIALPPYKVAGRVGREGNVVRVRGLDGTVGSSDIGGDASVDLGREPVQVRGDLASKRVDFADLAGLIGLPPNVAKDTNKTAGEAPPVNRESQAENDAYARSDRVLPDAKIDAAAWRNLDLDVRYQGRSVNAPKLPVQNLAFHVVTKRGWLTLDPFQAEIAGGRVVANASLDGSAPARPVDGKFDFKVSDLRLSQFMAPFGLQNDALGTFGGRAQLDATGGSLRELAASADGRVALTMEGGTVNSIIPQLASLKGGPAAITYLQQLFSGEGEKVPLRCFIADLPIQNGVMQARTVLVDTPDDKLTVTGDIDLRGEQMNLIFHAYPRNPSFGSSRMPISIQGPMKSPNVAPAPGYVQNQTLGWVLSPLAALFPFVELGSKDDHPCTGVVDRVREDASSQ